MSAVLPGCLKWLSRLQGVKGQCYIVASPDPRKQGWGFSSKGIYYALRFGTDPGIEADDYNEGNPNYAYTYNYSKAFLSMSNPPPRLDILRRSDWTWVIDSGIKNSHGQGVNDVIVNLIKGFPKHNFESEEGIRQAVQDMAERLNEVATFEEDHGQYSSGVYGPARLKHRRKSRIKKTR